MKLKKIISALLTAALLLATCGPGMASQPFTMDYDRDTGRVTISGTVQLEQEQPVKVTVEVLKPGKTPEDLKYASGQNLLEMLSFAGEQYTDKQGNFSFSYVESAASGKYGLLLRIQLSQAVWTPEAMEFFSPAELKQLLADLNAPQPDFAGLISEKAGMLGVDNTRYLAFSETERQSIDQRLLELRQAEQGQNFASVNAFAKAYYSALAIASFNAAKNAAEIFSCMTDFESAVQFSASPAYPTYKSLSEEGKTAVAGQMAAFNTYGDNEDILRVFREHTVLQGVRYVRNHVEVGTILKENQAWIGLSIDAFSALKDQSPVTRALAGQSFSSIASLVQHFQGEVAKQQAAENSTPPTARPSGGGGGGGGMTVSNPTATPAPTPTPTVTPAPTPSAEGFDDLDAVPWAAESILRLAERHIVSGKSGRQFAPEDPVTREEFVKLLVLTFAETDPSAVVEYADIPKGHWAYSYVATANKLGIVNGVSENEFGAGMMISREDMAVMVQRAAVLAGIPLSQDETLSFADGGQISGYARASVAIMANSGLINGKGGGLFEPKGTATRAEAAKIIDSTDRKGAQE